MAAPGDIRGLGVHPVVEVNPVTGDSPLLQAMVTRMGALKYKYYYYNLYLDMFCFIWRKVKTFKQIAAFRNVGQCC